MRYERQERRLQQRKAMLSIGTCRDGVTKKNKPEDYYLKQVGNAEMGIRNSLQSALEVLVVYNH